MNDMDMNKDNKIEITEMFMAEAGGKCFYGTLSRSKDANGNPHLFSRIVINDGLVQACAGDLRVLGRMLDEMCSLVIENGLHNDSGIYINIIHDKLFLN